MSAQRLFDIVPLEERQPLLAAMDLLGDDQIDEAESAFERLLTMGKSEKTHAFCHYGLGTCWSKKAKSIDVERWFDHAIEHYTTTLAVLEFADVHLMLGYALSAKLAANSKEQGGPIVFGPELRELCKSAIDAFERAKALNHGFASDCEEMIGRLVRMVE